MLRTSRILQPEQLGRRTAVAERQREQELERAVSRRLVCAAQALLHRAEMSADNSSEQQMLLAAAASVLEQVKVRGGNAQEAIRQLSRLWAKMKDQ